jgi:hypothetical protein
MFLSKGAAKFNEANEWFVISAECDMQYPSSYRMVSGCAPGLCKGAMVKGIDHQTSGSGVKTKTLKNVNCWGRCFKKPSIMTRFLFMI